MLFVLNKQDEEYYEELKIRYKERKIRMAEDCYSERRYIQQKYLDCKNKKECEKYKIVFQQYQCEKLAETLKKQ